MSIAKQTPRRFLALLVSAVLGSFGLSAFGKAAYLAEDAMIARAEVIAIVDITRVQPTTVKGQVWTYSTVADATVVQTLKGELPAKAKFHGGESFICAQVNFAPGRYLVFLRRDGELFVGCNWEFSVRPIKGKQIEWFVSGQKEVLSWQPLDGVLALIKKSSAKDPGR